MKFVVMEISLLAKLTDAMDVRWFMVRILFAES